MILQISAPSGLWKDRFLDTQRRLQGSTVLFVLILFDELKFEIKVFNNYFHFLPGEPSADEREDGEEGVPGRAGLHHHPLPPRAAPLPDLLRSHQTAVLGTICPLPSPAAR